MDTACRYNVRVLRDCKCGDEKCKTCSWNPSVAKEKAESGHSAELVKRETFCAFKFIPRLGKFIIV